MSDPNGTDDPDRDARSQALRFVGRRTLIWVLPLGLVGALLVGLGIPLWVSIVAMLLVLLVLVLELDL